MSSHLSQPTLESSSNHASLPHSEPHALQSQTPQGHETSLDVPIIDLERLRRGDPEQSQALFRGLSELGLIHISNHGLDPNTLENFYREFDLFCQRPVAEKETLSRADLWFQRGWTPPDTERAVIAGGQPDFKECYFAAPEDPDATLSAEYPQIFAENIWPRGQGEASFKADYLEIGRGLHAVGLELLRGVAYALNLAPETFNDYIEGGAHVTRALHYLPLDESQVNTGIRWGEEHTDFNLLTLLPGGRSYDAEGAPYQAREGVGLYLRARANDERREGRRVRGAAPKGCIIAQVGQQLEILTGGTLLATPHEVLPPNEAGVHRFSMAHFMHTHPHRILTPLAPLKTVEATLEYSPPVLAGTYSLKTLVDIGLAPTEELDKLGYRHYRRLSEQRAQEQR